MNRMNIEDALDKKAGKNDRSLNLYPKGIESKNNQNQEQKRSQQLNSRISRNKFGFKRWTNIEKVRYVMFLTNYKPILEKDDRADKYGIFTKMGKFIKTKKGQKCKTIHKRLVQRYKSIDGVIDYYKRTLRFDEEEVRKQTQRMKEFFENDRLKQQNAITAYNPRNSHTQNIPTFKFELINSYIKLFIKWNQRKKYISSVNTQTTNDVYFDLQIMQQITLVIQKKSHNYAQKEESQQNQSKIKTYQKNSSKKPSWNRNYLVVNNSKQQNVMQQQNRQIQQATIQQKSSKYVYYERMIVKRKNSQKHKQQKNQQIFQQLNDQMLHQQENDQYVQNQKCKPTEKYHYSGKIWTMSEIIKLIIFLNINKENFQSKNKLKRGILTKLSKYIGTGKTSKQCLQRLSFYRRKYKKNMVRIIEDQTKRLGIPQDLIEKQRRQYQFIDHFEQRLIRCDINILNQTIVHKINKKFSDFHQNQAINQLLNMQLPVSIGLDIISHSCDNDLKQFDNQLKQRQQNQLASKWCQQQVKQKEIFCQSESQMVKINNAQDFKCHSRNEVIYQQIHQQDKLVQIGDYHDGQKNKNYIKYKLTIKVTSRIFQMLKKSLKQRVQQQEKIRLVDQTNDYIITEIQVKQPVQIVFTEDVNN